MQALYQVPKLLTAVGKKDTFKDFTVMSFISGKKNDICGSSCESLRCSQTEETDISFSIAQHAEQSLP